MNTLARILVFGTVSGLLWSVAPGIFYAMFNSRADVPAIVTAGIVSGIVTSAIVALLLIRFNPGMTVVFGLLSLPFGAFIFGFSVVLVAPFFPGFTGVSGAHVEPWTLGFAFAGLSVFTIASVGLFPLAVCTTLLLKSFILRGRSIQEA